MDKLLFDELKTKPADVLPVNVTAKVMAGLLGLSVKRLTNMVSEGTMVAAGTNTYELKTCIKMYLDILRARTGKKKDGIEAAKLEKLERENKLAAEMLIDVNLVGRIVMGLASMVVNELEGLAPRVAPELAGEDDPAKVQKELYEECRRIREAISRNLQDYGYLPEFCRDIDPAPTKIN